MYRGWLAKDLRAWTAKGLLDARTAEALLAEYDGRASTFSAGKVLLVLAAVLISSAILLLVASNWEAIPRLARVVGIAGLIWGFYIAAALFKEREHPAIANALLVLGTITFGGGIALTGQMYHLSGDAVDAVLLWFGGAVMAAVLFRSTILTVFSGFLSWAVFATILSDGPSFHEDRLLWLTPLMGLGLLVLVYYTEAFRARHLVYILLVAWLGWIYSENATPQMALAIAAAGFIGFVLATVPVSPVYGLARAAGASPAFYTFLVAVFGLLAMHLDVDTVGGSVLLGGATIALSIAGLVLTGRDNGAVRYLGYLVFALETLYLADETIGSILGTSGFFLVSGLVVTAIAFLVIRIERRLSPARG